MRLAAAEELSRAGPRGQVLLVDAMQRSSSARVRSAAAMGLGHSGAHAARVLLLSCRDRDVRVRSAVWAALEHIGLTGLVRELRNRPPSQLVRAHAVAVLAGLCAHVDIGNHRLCRCCAGG